MPQISVIVPVYKVEPYLRRCLDSILRQTFTDFELILVDDGSPDNCPAICDEYAAKDSRVVVIHQENGGLSAARNAGIDWAFANSDSQWITFIDSDDWVHVEYLERLYRAARDFDVSVSMCGYKRVGEIHDDLQLEALDVKSWIPEDLYVERNTNATIACAKLYLKECFWEIRYPVGRIHEDEYVTYRILFACSAVAVIDEPLYSYFINNDGITKAQWNPKRLDSLDAVMEQIEFMKECGYDRACEAATKNYILCIANHLVRIKSDNPVDGNQYIPQLRSKLRTALFRHLRWFPFAEYKWLYSLAFPFMMECYWFFAAQWKKIVGEKK